MKTLLKVGRVFYGLAMVNMGINQLIFGDFRLITLPPWPAWRNTSPEIAAYLFGVALIGAGLLILLSNRHGKSVALALGGLLLGACLFWHLPFLLFISPHKISHFGLWADASKELALAGGAFVAAGAYRNEETATNETSKIFSTLEKLIPLGPVFYSITMIEYGIDHFLYLDYIATMVPSWMPGALFWTQFAGVALIGSGTSIAFKILLKPVALLQSLMIFIWFIFLHIPGAIEDPLIDHGNLVVSAGDALAFSGTALLIALAKR